MSEILAWKQFYGSIFLDLLDTFLLGAKHTLLKSLNYFGITKYFELGLIHTDDSLINKFHTLQIIIVGASL